MITKTKKMFKKLVNKDRAYFHGNLYSGNYFHYKSGGYESCREIFGNNFNTKTKSFFYQSIKKSNIDNIIKFITKIETQLNLKQEDRISFQLTSHDNFIKIIVSPWWRENKMRREFLTAAVKSAAQFSQLKYKFNEVVKTSRYFQKSSKAFERFLDGNVFYTKRFQSGWCRTFNNNRNIDFLSPNKQKVNTKQVVTIS